MPYDLNIPYRLVLDDKIIISYPTRHEIEVYDANSYTLTQKIMPKSDIRFPTPVSTQNSNDEQLLWNHRITTPFYEPLFYHSALKVFSRILHHSQELKPNGATLNNGENRNATILIFDNNLRILKTIDFTKGKIGVRKAIAMSEGILVAPHEKYWDTDNHLVYQNIISF